MRQEGTPLVEIGALLGHGSPATTQRYAHLQEEPSAAVPAALREDWSGNLPDESHTDHPLGL